MKLVDLTGQRFGRLTVVERAGSAPAGRPLWNCRCACGGAVVVVGANLKNGNTRSCGCLRAEECGKTGARTAAANSRAGTEKRVKHGHARAVNRHPLYSTWNSMKDRCRNPRNPKYRLYGGRGIRVCSRWEDFVAFLADMGTKPSPKHSIDRIDNDGNYEPGNVRWATPHQQNRNRRRSVSHAA